ncbi:MAG: NgoMIV family type II restriction endonuclease [Pseudoflavonifractor sp.]|nr:NgoMIV family type II restriction endonuclease [Alloprevotella sp.]MCM1117309.1 NgoMIV family type II restriction endonuclease [Pseudoflavonifractor sp.]
MEALISQERRLFHRSLVNDHIITISNGVASNADSSSKLSTRIALSIAEQLGAHESQKAEGQTIGSRFENVSANFLANTFLKFQDLRPGRWHVEKLGNRNSVKTYSFTQYEHLRYLETIVKEDSQLATCIGNDYIIAPDIVIYRDPEPDETINNASLIVDDKSSKLTSMRERYSKLPILHASISAKWTMRSDHAQNSGTEALGLIRNRKGHLPHIDVITGEPLPARLASLALGTGDIDCLYHFALYELIEAVTASNAEDALEMLNILISGKRLKDISDLPLDLIV